MGALLDSIRNRTTLVPRIPAAVPKPVVVWGRWSCEECAVYWNGDNVCFNCGFATGKAQTS